MGKETWVVCADWFRDRTRMFLLMTWSVVHIHWLSFREAILYDEVQLGVEKVHGC